ncbi:MAG TPA: 2Fe-2S iron-sulfur cluster-binding protein, partial [Dehalococcoidia bacterium]|nr:2Fe-2S iron-sulfur cluster-binding protein [Dehalococcoidia bacterium]
MSQKKEKIIITIDDMEVKAGIGESLLWCALDNDIYIPNLCAIRDNSKPLAACRLCYVEIDRLTNPVTACTVKVKDGMRVRLNT